MGLACGTNRGGTGGPLRAGGQVLGESGHRRPREAAWGGSHASLNQGCFLGGEEGVVVSLERDEESALPAPHQPVPPSEAFIPEPGFQLLPAPPWGGSDHPKARLVAGLTPQGSLPLRSHLPSPPCPPPPAAAWQPCPLTSCPGPLLCRPLRWFQAVLTADSCSCFGTQVPAPWAACLTWLQAPLHSGAMAEMLAGSPLQPSACWHSQALRVGVPLELKGLDGCASTAVDALPALGQGWEAPGSGD